MKATSFIKYLALLALCFGMLFSCKQPTKVKESGTASQNIHYAKGFTLSELDNHSVLSIINPWPNAQKKFRYALVKKGTTLENPEAYDAIVTVPVDKIVVTSTTHIPSLEALGVENTLVGFPNLKYVSSKKTRENIASGNIKELGKNEALNTEVLIALAPDVVVSFTLDGNNKSLQTIKKTGIPVLINADWTETHPLGKAEWIKFFGALYNKNELAERLFNTIETNYTEAKKIAQNTTTQPTVLSGAMFKDIWYMPQGNSWAARFIEDAHGDYLWKNSKGTGSIALNIESVLEKGQQATFWIGPGQFTNKEQLLDSNNVYGQFDAFKNNNVFAFTNKKGETGGVLYYELAPNRPDLVLKDIIKILHPTLLPEYHPYFFEAVE
ncbi:MAG: iron complex transport system substrate-binding protein [Patiriisocius sp.]|jgi:iron complex transport system substrate-binding protein